MAWQRLGLWIALVCALSGFVYCLAGALQAAWLSATPDFPVDRATEGFYFWGMGCILMLCLLILLAGLLIKTRPREAKL